MQANSIAALVSAGLCATMLSGCATPSDQQLIIERLDLTSFANSTGPRRVEGQWSLVDYGFVDQEQQANSTMLLRQDRGWQMGFAILSADTDSLDICFFDGAMARPGDLFKPSYNARSALRVSRAGDRWPAQQIAAGLPDCQNDPQHQNASQHQSVSQ